MTLKPTQYEANVQEAIKEMERRREQRRRPRTYSMRIVLFTIGVFFLWYAVQATYLLEAMKLIQN